MAVSVDTGTLTGTNYMHTYGINFFKVFIAVPAVKSARLT